jgi:Ca2+-binding RTX toxin-like protein
VGGSGPDVIRGRGGNDVIVGGRGRDTLEGGAGNDRINARDGAVDVVRCGTGRDVVIADRVDRVARDCEVVRRR